MSGKCTNRCQADGQEWREELGARIRAAELGANARLEYARKGIAAVGAAEEQITEKKARVEEVSGSLGRGGAGSLRAIGRAQLEEQLAGLRARRSEADASHKEQQAAVCAESDAKVEAGLGLGQLGAEQLRAVVS